MESCRILDKAESFVPNLCGVLYVLLDILERQLRGPLRSLEGVAAHLQYMPFWKKKMVGGNSVIRYRRGIDAGVDAPFGVVIDTIRRLTLHLTE